MSIFSETRSLDLELEDCWLNVWFNEPEIKNPLTEQRVGELINLCKYLESNLDIRGVTFRGREGIFCAGADLKAVKMLFFENTPRKKILEFSRVAGNLMHMIFSLPQITIMAVEGAAMAGGFGLACLGDIVLADKEAKFSLTETKLGLTPVQISPYVIHKLGYKNAKLLLLTGMDLQGNELSTVGLADKVTNSNEEMNEAIRYYKSLVLRCAPGAVAETKKIILSVPYLNLKDQMEMTAQYFTDRVMSNEAREGVMSFIEKRKPNWYTNKQ